MPHAEVTSITTRSNVKIFIEVFIENLLSMIRVKIGGLIIKS
jgi:hypothetical protein